MGGEESIEEKSTNPLENNGDKESPVEGNEEGDNHEDDQVNADLAVKQPEL